MQGALAVFFTAGLIVSILVAFTAKGAESFWFGHCAAWMNAFLLVATLAKI